MEDLIEPSLYPRDLDEWLCATFVTRLSGISLSPNVSCFIVSHQKLSAALNQREFDVLKLLIDELETKAIAHQVGLWSNRIYRILHLMREAFHAQNNAHLIKITHQMKLFEPGTFD